MLRAEKVTLSSPLFTKIEPLYVRAFPANERGPLHFFMVDAGWDCEMIAFLDEDIFCGFAVLLNIGTITHIMYFAMQEELRNRGYGAAALQLLFALKPQKRIIADIEKETAEAENNPMRRRRRQFYFRNGFALSPVSYTWRKESYDIVVHGGALTEAEFDAFWDCAQATAKAAQGKQKK